MISPFSFLTPNSDILSLLALFQIHGLFCFVVNVCIPKYINTSCSVNRFFLYFIIEIKKKSCSKRLFANSNWKKQALSKYLMKNSWSAWSNKKFIMKEATVRILKQFTNVILYNKSSNGETTKLRLF